MTPFTIGLTAYIVAASAWIISENRRPQSTFAWLFLLVLLPFVGPVVYLLFGRMRGGFGRTGRLVRQDQHEPLAPMLAEARAEHDAAMARFAGGDGFARNLATLVDATSDGLVTTSNRVEVLQDAARMYPRLLDDIAAATRSVHLQSYIWRADAFGERLLALLARKAAEGVEVRALYDPVGSVGLVGSPYLRRMRAAGIRVAPTSPLWHVTTISYRDHRKLAVIDGRVAYCGGLNLGDEHLDPGPPWHVWRDTHLRITGQAARSLQAVFAVDWANASGEPRLGPEHFPPVGDGGDGVPVQVVVGGPDSAWRAVRQQYMGMIAGARRTLRIQTPYFVPDPSIAEALKAAALAGVRVSLMAPGTGPDHRLPFWAARTYLAEVATAGVEVLLHRGFLHAKTVTVDGAVASVGSGNWDVRSFSINYELNAVLYDADLTRRLEADFDADRALCDPFDPDAYRAGPRLGRFRDSIARVLSPIL